MPPEPPPGRQAGTQPSRLCSAPAQRHARRTPHRHRRIKWGHRSPLRGHRRSRHRHRRRSRGNRGTKWGNPRRQWGPHLSRPPEPPPPGTPPLRAPPEPPFCRPVPPFPGTPPPPTPCEPPKARTDPPKPPPEPPREMGEPPDGRKAPFLPRTALPAPPAARFPSATPSPGREPGRSHTARRSVSAGVFIRLETRGFPPPVFEWPRAANRPAARGCAPAWPCADFSAASARAGAGSPSRAW